MNAHTPEKDLRYVSDAATDAGCTPRYVWHLLARGDLTRYRAAGRTYVDVNRLRALLTPRPV